MSDFDDVSPDTTAKIAAKFGFPSGSDGEPAGDYAPGPNVQPEAQDEGSSSEPVTTPGLEEFEWEGAKLSVPKSLREAVMKNEDYTRKTQELAEHRRALDQAREGMQRAQIDSQFQQSIASEAQEISVIDAYLKEAGKLNWSQMNMEQLLRTRAEVDQVKERRAGLQESIRGKRTQYDAAIKQHLDKLRANSRELSAKSIQGFNEQTEKALRDFAVAEGLSEAEADSVLLDPRSTKILWKAQQFAQVQANAGKAVGAATRVLKPGGDQPRMPAKTAADLNFRKAMKGARSSGEKAEVIAAKLESGSIFNRGH
jgi:hypothetical protein